MLFFLMRTMFRCSLLCISTFLPISLLAQVECPGGPFPDPKQRIVNNLHVPGAENVLSYVEHLPDDYYTTGNKKYPLFLWLHGIGELGGDPTGCRLFDQWFWVPPSMVELNKWPYSVKNQSGETFKFILISPRMAWFDPASINVMIDNLIRYYRVDPSRIYLSGISAGANTIMKYITASDYNARRVAAVSLVAPCDLLDFNGARVIQRNNLHVYAVKCVQDNCGDGTAANLIAATINVLDPTKALAVASTLPLPGWPCNSYAHDSWGTAYDTNFRQNIYGRYVNMYEWMVQFTNAGSAAVPPTALEDFTVRSSNGKVYVRPDATTEGNSSHFAIVSPNPFAGNLKVSVNIDKVQPLTFTITDVSGRVIKRLNGTYNKGPAEIRFDGGNVPRGVYFLKIAGENFSETHKIVRQ